MKEQNNRTGLTRRKFIGNAAAVAALSMVPRHLTGSIIKLSNPDTNFKGIQVGVIAPFSFRGLPGTADDILGYLLKLGMTTVELQSAPFEQFAGAPVAPPRAPAVAAPAAQTSAGVPAGQTSSAQAATPPPQAMQSPSGTPTSPTPAGTPQRAPLTPEQQAIQDKYAADLKAWRLSVPMTRYEELRKKYSDAGVTINLVKFDSFTSTMSAAEIDYCFLAAKALGAKAITTGLTDETKAKLLGPYADKHKIWIGLHNQTHIIPETLDLMLSYGKYMGLNFDLGHHTSGSDIPLVTIIEKYKDRIVSLHLTDRKIKGGASMPFGEGDTPLKEVLQYCVARKYLFEADIDLEYPVPAGSDSVTEVGRCVQYCRDALA